MLGSVPSSKGDAVPEMFFILNNFHASLSCPVIFPHFYTLCNVVVVYKLKINTREWIISTVKT